MTLRNGSKQTFLLSNSVTLAGVCVSRSFGRLTLGLMKLSSPAAADAAVSMTLTDEVIRWHYLVTKLLLLQPRLDVIGMTVHLFLISRLKYECKLHVSVGDLTQSPATSSIFDVVKNKN